MREWILLQRGYFDSLDNEYKMRWEMARWQVRIIARPSYKPGFEQSLKFPWDPLPEDPVMTEEELKEFTLTMGTKFENGKFVN